MSSILVSPEKLYSLKLCNRGTTYSLESLQNLFRAAKLNDSVSVSEFIDGALSVGISFPDIMYVVMRKEFFSVKGIVNLKVDFGERCINKYWKYYSNDDKFVKGIIDICRESIRERDLDNNWDLLIQTDEEKNGLEMIISYFISLMDSVKNQKKPNFPLVEKTYHMLNNILKYDERVFDFEFSEVYKYAFSMINIISLNMSENEKNALIDNEIEFQLEKVKYWSNI